jgi:hypothetical protein
MTPTRPLEPPLPSNKESKECNLISRGTRRFHAAIDEHGGTFVFRAGWANQTSTSSEMISQGGLAGGDDGGGVGQLLGASRTFVLVDNGSGGSSESVFRRMLCLVSSGESFSERFLRLGVLRTSSGRAAVLPSS